METKKRNYTPKVCSKCYRNHYNKKYTECNICLKRKKCKSPKCVRVIDKEYLYCFKCNKNFMPKSFNIPKGVCLLD